MILLPPVPVQPLVYTTLASYWEGRPTLAMDGDLNTAFRSYRGMGQGDGFTVLLSRAVPVRSVRIDTEGLQGASLETTVDGTVWTKAATFTNGVAEAKPKEPIAGVRIRLDRRSVPSLVVKEIKFDTSEPMAPALRGPGRGFHDLGEFKDLQGWADKAQSQMISFWEQTEAILYSKGFVPPNAVYVVYKDEAGLPPGMAGGGVMTVSVPWARAHPEDTGLTVHEAAHIIQSGGAPGWIVEAIADYVRWIRFEPQNFTYRIDLEKGTPRDPYRSGAAFLAYCETRYDPGLVTKLYDAARFGKYNDGLFQAYCGKPIDELYKEFIVEYKKDSKAVLVAPVPEGMRPRPLPTVAPGTSRTVDLAYDAIGITKDGAKFRETGGFDEGGAAYSGSAIGREVRINGVTFKVGPVGSPNVAIARGQSVRVNGKHKSLWLLASAVEGGQRNASVIVNYADSSSVKLTQNFSDWFEPDNFPGEVKAVQMPYRNLADGTRDERPFLVYAYGLPLDGTKELRSITLPNNPNIRILAVSLAN